MLLREALRLAERHNPARGGRAAVVCAFEPLHFRAFLQAMLIERLSDEAPTVVTFGFDRLHEALEETETTYRREPAALFLTWSDLHPALSWNTRTPFSTVASTEFHETADPLVTRTHAWFARRRGAQTVVVLPPDEWLPPVDSVHPRTIGPTAVLAQSAMLRVATGALAVGATVIKASGPVSFRELMQAGCPLAVDTSADLARRCCDAWYRAPRKKAIVTDLDGTLWKGVLGEDGVVGIDCSAHGSGAAFHVLQKYLAKLKREGILLAYSSKNEQADVEQAFATLDAPLSLSDFAAGRCGWSAKSSSIVDLAAELGLALDSMIVLDDSPAELAEITANVPEVTTLRTPVEGAEWLALFDELQRLCFTPRVREEDRFRTGASELLRRDEVARTAGPRGLAHLKAMEQTLSVVPDAFADSRVLELINKTNQFNLTGERFDEAAWLEWAEQPGAFCVSCRLDDRFGPYGTIAAVTGRRGGGRTLDIRQLVVSCRALGRGVETVLLDWLVRMESASAATIAFQRTARNAPAAQFVGSFGRRSAEPSSGCLYVDIDELKRAADEVLAQTGMQVLNVEPGKTVG